MEDLTPPERVAEDGACDREVALYGFLRGANLRPGARMHLAGAGDFSVRMLLCQITLSAAEPVSAVQVLCIGVPTCGRARACIWPAPWRLLG